MARFNIKYFHIFIYIGFECGILMFHSVMRNITQFIWKTWNFDETMESDSESYYIQIVL